MIQEQFGICLLSKHQVPIDVTAGWAHTLHCTHYTHIRTLYILHTYARTHTHTHAHAHYTLQTQTHIHTLHYTHTTLHYTHTTLHYTTHTLHYTHYKHTLHYTRAHTHTHTPHYAMHTTHTKQSIWQMCDCHPVHEPALRCLCTTQELEPCTGNSSLGRASNPQEDCPGLTERGCGT